MRTLPPVPDALAPPPGNPRFALFDALRAIAALSVLVSHTAGATGFNAGNSVLGPLSARLNVGVTVFFVISGFLLYRPFVAARMEGRSPPRVARYARRRALRILPAYWLALTLLATWPGLNGIFTADWWAYYGLVQNLDSTWLVSGLAPAWSLCIEVSFYAALPLYAWAVSRGMDGRGRERQMRAELWALAALALASVTARTVVHVTAPDTTFGWTLPATFLWFALGMGMAVAHAGLAGREPGCQPRAVRLVVDRPLAVWGLALATLVVLSRVGLPDRAPYVYSEGGWLLEHVGFALFAFLLVLPAAFGEGHGGLPRAVLGSRVLTWLGLVSYGIYLWHVPLALKLADAGAAEWTPDGGFLLVTLLTAAAATTCAALSYYVVERPILRFKDPRPPRAPAAAPHRRAAEQLRPAD